MLLLTHRAKQVDFKFQVVRQVDGAWEFFDTMADPETTGNFKLSADGNSLDVFATAPRKWCKKFVKEADGSWKCISPDFPGTTAVASDITPAPSKLGAGGLPKGMVNLGDDDEDVRGGFVLRYFEGWGGSGASTHWPALLPLTHKPFPSFRFTLAGIQPPRLLITPSFR